MSSCGSRTRRNRRSHGGAQMGANLQEAFADLKGKAGFVDGPKPPAPPAQPPAQKGGRRNRRKSHGGANHNANGANLSEAFADMKGDAAAKPPAAPQPPANGAAQKGGRRKSHKSRKTRKMSKGAQAWTTAVTKLYRQMKAKDKSVKFSDALKHASALKKKGQL